MNSSSSGRNTAYIFIDIEFNPETKRIIDLAAIKSCGASIHTDNVSELIKFLSDVKFICGHNIIKHDIDILMKYLPSSFFDNKFIIDTLYLSPLLYPSKPYHSLVKDDKLYTEGPSNPLNDSRKSLDLFLCECSDFNSMPSNLKIIYFLLLKNLKEFEGFFNYLSFTLTRNYDVSSMIFEEFHGKICESVDLEKIVVTKPIELAYSLSIIGAENKYSLTPPWVFKNYPSVDRILHLLRNKPCLRGCLYCNEKLNANKALEKYFGFKAFRK